MDQFPNEYLRFTERRPERFYEEVVVIRGSKKLCNVKRSEFTGDTREQEKQIISHQPPESEMGSP